MKKIMVISLLFITLAAFANEFNLLKFRALAADFQAERNSVQDMDGNYCSAIKIESDFTDQISLKQKVYQKEVGEDGVIYFYISHLEEQITFTAPNHKPLTIDVPKNGLKKGKVYYARLESVPDTPEEIVEKVAVTAPTAEIPTNDDFIEERMGITFQVTNVEMFDKQVIIHLLITNNNDDMDLLIHGWAGKKYTRFIDDAGNEFKPSKIIFANNSGNRDIKTNLIQGIATKATITFKEINSKANKIAKFDLGIWSKQADSFRISYRDIPIEKK